MSSQIPERFVYQPVTHTYIDTVTGCIVPAEYFKQKEKPVRKLSKAEQMDLMFMWNEDKNLELIYKSFERFVEARVGKYVREGDI